MPPYDLSSPYEKVPFQYSLHVVDSRGKRARHHSFIFDGVADPRPEVLTNLRKLLGKKGSIVSFCASFEMSVLRSCAYRYPAFAGWFDSVKSRIVDLHVPFRDFHYCHPDQDGSTSLKAILPILTNKGYDGLAISAGSAASLRFREMAFGDLKAAEKRAIREALETYCHRDSEGMVEIVKALGRLAR